MELFLLVFGPSFALGFTSGHERWSSIATTVRFEFKLLHYGNRSHWPTLCLRHDSFAYISYRPRTRDRAVICFSDRFIIFVIHQVKFKHNGNYCNIPSAVIFDGAHDFVQRAAPSNDEPMLRESWLQKLPLYLLSLLKATREWF